MPIVIALSGCDATALPFKRERRRTLVVARLMAVTSVWPPSSVRSTRANITPLALYLQFHLQGLDSRLVRCDGLHRKLDWVHWLRRAGSTPRAMSLGQERRGRKRGGRGAECLFASLLLSLSSPETHTCELLKAGNIAPPLSCVSAPLFSLVHSTSTNPPQLLTLTYFFLFIVYTAQHTTSSQ